MSRIVAGSAGGRNLKVPKTGTRPTSERVREGLFSRLEHHGYVRDCAILDLFAGSGAIGLEAKSRGAGRVVCVEAHKAAAAVVEKNSRITGLDIDVVNTKAENYLAREPVEKFDVAFLDPPYDFEDNKLAVILEMLVPHLAEDGMVVVERLKHSPEPVWPATLVLEDERKWGDTRVWSAIRPAKE